VGSIVTHPNAPDRLYADKLGVDSDILMVAYRVFPEYLHDVTGHGSSAAQSRVVKHARFECKYGADNMGERPNPVLAQHQLRGLESIAPPDAIPALKQITYFG
jgi:hypothetical protein